MENKKGFTLIELIGVIMIIAVLSLLFFPNLIKKFQESNENLDATTTKIILDSAEHYVDNNSNLFSKSKSYCISISTLIDNEYLVDNFADFNKEKLINNKIIKVVGDGNNFDYSIVNTSDCSTDD